MNPNSCILIFMLIIGIHFSHHSRMIVATEGVSAFSFDGVPSLDFPARKFNFASKRWLRSSLPPPPPPKRARATQFRPKIVSPPPPSPLPPPIST
ncbi:hypothetical protein CRYUN_Cryun16bG0054100 [Craigia yunnanensis]